MTTDTLIDYPIFTEVIPQYPYDTTPMACAKRGAEWLDTIDPDWYTKVPVEHIYLATVDQCICGWVFANHTNTHGSGYGYMQDRYWNDLYMRAKGTGVHPSSYHGFAGTAATEEAWRMQIAHRYAMNAA